MKDITSEYIGKWFDWNIEKIGEYNLHELKETDKISKEELMSILVERIAEHYISPDIFEDNLQRLGKRNLAKELKHALPSDNNVKTMMGDFGEILTAEHLHQNHNYSIFHKLRYKPNPEKSLHGEDVVLFELDDNGIVSIGVAESKAWQKYTSGTYKEASNQVPDRFKLMKYMRFLKNIYSIKNTEEEKKIYSSLLEYFEDIEEGSFPRTNWLFFISDEGLHLLKDHIEKEKELHSNFNFVGIHIKGLGSFVDKLYRLCKNSQE